MRSGTYSILLLLCLLFCPALAHASCDSVLKAGDRIAELQAGIDALQAETLAVPARQWTRAQLEEIRSQGITARDDESLVRFYTTRLEASLKRLEEEKHWLKAPLTLAEIRKAHPEAVLGEEDSLAFIRNLLDYHVVADVSFEQLEALRKSAELHYKMIDVRRETSNLLMKIGKAKSYQKMGRWEEALGDPEIMGQELAQKQGQLAQLELQQQTLVQENFPKNAFKRDGDLISVLLERRGKIFEERMRSCCGANCYNCPIQRQFHYYGAKVNPPKHPTLALFQWAPRFDGLILDTFDPSTYNKREKKLIAKRKPGRGHDD